MSVCARVRASVLVAQRIVHTRRATFIRVLYTSPMFVTAPRGGDISHHGGGRVGGRCGTDASRMRIRTLTVAVCACVGDDGARARGGGVPWSGVGRRRAGVFGTRSFFRFTLGSFGHFTASKILTVAYMQ